VEHPIHCIVQSVITGTTRESQRDAMARPDFATHAEAYYDRGACAEEDVGILEARQDGLRSRYIRRPLSPGGAGEGVGAWVLDHISPEERMAAYA